MADIARLLLLWIALAFLSGFVWSYARGGRSDRWVRVWAGGLLFPLGLVFLAHWAHHLSDWSLLGFVTYPAALSQGYGAEAAWKKVRRRLQYGVGLGFAAAPFLLPLGLWEALLFQVAVAVAVSVWAGVRNPTSAVGEEGLISLLGVAVTPFMLIQ